MSGWRLVALGLVSQVVKATLAAATFAGLVAVVPVVLLAMAVL